MKLILQGGLLGGLILFVWSAISWMALPFHASSMHSFQNETLVQSAVMASLDQNHGGVYMLPKDHKKSAGNPSMLAVIRPQGCGPVGVSMLIGFLMQCLGAALATGLLLKTGGMNYWGRVGFILMFAMAVGVVAVLPGWNWWGFSAAFIAVEFMDLFIGWFLAGLVIAKITK